MKKNSTTTQRGKRAPAGTEANVIGIDLGDKTSRYCGLDRDGKEREEGSVATTKQALTQRFAGKNAAGSPWKLGRIRHG